ILITAIFVSMSITLYLPHRPTEHIESMRPNCKLISENRKTNTELGFTGKALRFGTISLMPTFPKAYARKGLIGIKEANQLPSHTEKLLSRLVIVCLALFLALLLFRAFLYIADHYQTL
ncbi:hypothetical protein, partial [Pseudomonas putida]|uniref:hypothetical protein n=1 Tax=Pseudomonas putida TaxID=303 RepID=UPI003905E10F